MNRSRSSSILAWGYHRTTTTATRPKSKSSLLHHSATTTAFGYTHNNNSKRTNNKRTYVSASSVLQYKLDRARSHRPPSSNYHTTPTTLHSSTKHDDSHPPSPSPPPLLDARTYMTTTTNTIIPKPKALSPSSAACFKQCPQSYLFQYLFNIKQPTNQALAKGSMCHSALEKVFELEPMDRTLENLQNLLRKVWGEKRLSDAYRPLFDYEPEEEDRGGDGDGGEGGPPEPKRNKEAERKWGMEGLRLLENYYELEDPRLVPRPNPIEREIWVNAKLTINPSLGVTGYAGRSDTTTPTDDDEGGDSTFLVRGIVDRLDYVAAPPSPRSSNTSPDDGAGVLRIIDYKTGKAPNFKYSPAMNEKIANDTTWQLKIYALLLREMMASSNSHRRQKATNLQNLSGEELRLLRLMYLTSTSETEPIGAAKYLDMDLGETQEERDRILQDVHGELADIWKNILRLVETQDPTEFVHCDQKWCFCHSARARFVSGSVYARR